ncbi:hypothetical protein P4U43_15495 [Arthrobacter sp. EH-1B-1]|uniref:Lipoprotein n=1 Tax=Arthrobacter vasquezii TaxID=2977629 RepID=A0ABT6CZ85_9MICC|nr:hypothetical protein [Arthrobacter vasquezii]MDF9279193.1 hypothetical protein [Arthrobacter vasquezii]
MTQPFVDGCSQRTVRQACALGPASATLGAWGKFRPGAVVVVSSMLLAGCAGTGGPPVACPAIGWLNNVLVKLEGDVSAVAEVQGCVNGVCSQVVRPPTTDVPVEIITPAPGGTIDETGQKSHPPRELLSPYMATPLDEDSWVINLDMDTPRSSLYGLSLPTGRSSSRASSPWIGFG